MQDVSLWQNWSGLQQARPYLYLPKNIESLKNLVRTHEKIRVVGAGHSFSPLAVTEDVLVQLDQIKGIVSIDTHQCQSTVYAGTRLHDLGEKLTVSNQALINQGDIDQQSLAGAIATGTHGTGVSLPCLSAFVKGFELMTAAGDLLWCDGEENAEIFQAGRVSLGSLGIMTKIKMQNRSMYRLKETIRLCSLKTLFSELDQWKEQYRHIEFFAFIHCDMVILKTLDETQDSLEPKQDSWLDEDALLYLCAELTRIFPMSNAYLQRLIYWMIKPSLHVDWSSRIFASVRQTKFNEMEYQMPLSQGLACFEEVFGTLQQQRVPMFFPLEFRYVKGDDIWLSPFYERDSVSISIHQFYKQDHQKIFELVEPIFLKYQGRPHWGKLHTRRGCELAEMYPKWDAFLNLRAQLDPTRKWLNPYLEEIFGLQ